MTRKTPEERFWSKIALWDDCWIWLGGKIPKGYGMFWFEGRQIMAHHFLLSQSPSPTLQTDHLCRNRACVKPSHIEVVTRRENIRRGLSFSAINARKTTCIHGHIFDARNTYIRANGNRDCRRCHADRDAQRYWKNKQT